MTIKYGFLGYDEPKNHETEKPSKLYDFDVDTTKDIRSVVTVLSDDIFENLKNKLKFRFYAESENSNLTYQVDLTKESRDFFESELLDDLKTLLKK